MITKAENIPQELKTLKQWVCWVGKDKIPKNAYTGKNAMSNNPDTWADFDTAVSACNKYKFDGVGFMFANGYFGVDLDHCLDKVDFCDEFVETLQSYAEISKSGTGLHIICKGTLPSGSRRKNGVEMYSQGRYFICTGNIYNDKYKKIVDCTESVKVLHNKYLPSNTPKIQKAISTLTDISNITVSDQEIVDKARNCKSGYLFTMLYQGEWQGVYSSQSEADLALCNQLAFWTQKDTQQMDRIFRSSGLMRKKWDEHRGESTYGEITLSKACARCSEVYNPAKHDGKDTELAFAVFKNGQTGVSLPKKHYDLTDTGNAHRMCDKFEHIIRYSYNRKKWYYWDGKKWEIDDSGEVKKLADIICEDIKKEAFAEQDEKRQIELLKWANRTASSKGKENMIKECQHLDGIPASTDAFDSYTDFLNCQNGIVNLRNGELLSHDSEYMMSKITLCDYDTSNTPPAMWLKFLDDITSGNKELQEYIQKCVGYSLSGSIREQCAYFLYGMGNNGKSTFLDTISDMLGDYSANTQPETIMMKHFNESANSDVARLKSARYVTCEEPTEGVRLNEGLLKQLTGGSKITCRFLYGDEFEYTPEFKIWVATNHKPVIRGTDVGIWRRIKLIPFEVNIPPEKVDKSLKYKLRKEMPQILKWAVDGCIKWQREGIQEPECVQQAVKEYKNEMDLLTGFIEDAIEIDYTCSDRVLAIELFEMYRKWAKKNNEYEMTSKKFFKEIGNRLPEKGRVSAGVYYTKIRLTEYAEKNLMAQDYFKQYQLIQNIQ